MFESAAKKEQNLAKQEGVSAPAVDKALTEKEAENMLHVLLQDPDNKFLLEIPKNREIVEEADSAIDALAYAEHQIYDRKHRTFRFENLISVEGVTPHSVDYDGMISTVERIMRGAREIGRGGDAFVVIDRNEMRSLPPEVCYKVALKERTPRGRNSISEEAEIQGKFYDVMQSEKLPIGVPIPFYTLSIAEKKIIAMEKLHAASVDDVLRGRGELPVWFEVDSFCDALTKTIEKFHAHNLFHRDMHFGNVMITQGERPKADEKIGYIIDFGLSGSGIEDMDPYKKEVAGSLFTYDNDYGIVEKVRKVLHELRKRQYANLKATTS